MQVLRFLYWFMYTNLIIHHSGRFPLYPTGTIYIVHVSLYTGIQCTCQFIAGTCLIMYRFMFKFMYRYIEVYVQVHEILCIGRYILVYGVVHVSLCKGICQFMHRYMLVYEPRCMLIYKHVYLCLHQFLLVHGQVHDFYVQEHFSLCTGAYQFMY